MFFPKTFYRFRMVTTIPKFDESIPFSVEEVDNDVVHQLQMFFFILHHSVRKFINLN